MKTTTDMARQAGLNDEVMVPWAFELERFAEVVRKDERDRIARECARLPFGDTAASFAAWIAQGGGQTL